MGSGSIGQAFLSLVLDGMCGQLHTSADLHPGKISLNRRVGWPLGLAGCFHKRNVLCPCWESNYDSLAPSLQSSHYRELSKLLVSSVT